MNNITFGDEKFGHYETVAGGAGAVSLLFISLLCYSFLYSVIHFSTLLFISLLCYSFLYSVIHFSTLLFISLLCYSFLYSE